MFILVLRDAFFQIDKDRAVKVNEMLWKVCDPTTPVHRQ